MLKKGVLLFSIILVSLVSVGFVYSDGDYGDECERNLDCVSPLTCERGLCVPPEGITGPCPEGKLNFMDMSTDPCPCDSEDSCKSPNSMGICSSSETFDCRESYSCEDYEPGRGQCVSDIPDPYYGNIEGISGACPAGYSCFGNSTCSNGYYAVFCAEGHECVEQNGVLPVCRPIEVTDNCLTNCGCASETSCQGPNYGISYEGPFVFNCSSSPSFVDPCAEGYECKEISGQGSCRLDWDSDSVNYTDDNCPSKDNLDQLDSDNDSIGDACDNCIYVSNPEQLFHGVSNPEFNSETLSGLFGFSLENMTRYITSLTRDEIESYASDLTGREINIDSYGENSSQVVLFISFIMFVDQLSDQIYLTQDLGAGFIGDVCYKNSTAGEGCSLDRNCAGNLLCYHNECTRDRCRGVRCSPGKVCDMLTGECNFEACFSDEDCPGNSSCEDSRCVHDQPCATHEVCGSGDFCNLETELCEVGISCTNSEQCITLGNYSCFANGGSAMCMPSSGMDSNNTDEDGDGIADHLDPCVGNLDPGGDCSVVSSTGISCSDLDGVICDGNCINGNWSLVTREFNCCVPYITSLESVGCSGSSQFVPSLGRAIRYERTCLEGSLARVSVVDAGTGAPLEGDQLTILGLTSSTYTETDYSCGGLEVPSGDVESIPGFGIISLILAISLLFMFYFGNRKLLKS